MEENIVDYNNDSEIIPAERPAFLSVLCVLSFIWSGLIIIGSLIGALMAGTIVELLSNLLNDPAMSDKWTDQQVEVMEQFLNLGSGIVTAIFIAMIVFTSVSLLGVIKMWKQRKSGFIIYAVTNGLGLIFSLVRFDPLGIVITIGFIAMYWVNYKHMR